MATRTLRWADNPLGATNSALIVRWQWIALLLIGYPLLMTLRSLTWQAVGTAGLSGLGYYIPFWLTVIIFQAISIALVMRAMRSSGGGLADLGLCVPARRAALTLVGLAGLGLALVMYRLVVPSTAPTSVDAFSQPIALPDRLVWLVEAGLAAFSEELLYRGFAITALRSHGIPVILALMIAVLRWILNHGLTALDRAPFYMATGLLFGAIFVWRRSLYPVMVLHALVAFMTPVGLMR